MIVANVSGRVSESSRLGRFRAPLGAFVPGNVVGPLAVDSAVLASVLGTAPGRAFTGGPRHPHKQYHQSMARIAAMGGTSGPHPAWDPV